MFCLLYCGILGGGREVWCSIPCGTISLWHVLVLVEAERSKHYPYPEAGDSAAYIS